MNKAEQKNRYASCKIHRRQNGSVYTLPFGVGPRKVANELPPYCFRPRNARSNVHAKEARKSWPLRVLPIYGWCRGFAYCLCVAPASAQAGSHLDTLL